jgi:hypothetical protein
VKWVAGTTLQRCLPGGCIALQGGGITLLQPARVLAACGLPRLGLFYMPS